MTVSRGHYRSHDAVPAGDVGSFQRSAIEFGVENTVIGNDSIFRLHYIVVSVKARIKESDGDAAAGEAFALIQAKRRRQYVIGLLKYELMRINLGACAAE